MPIPRAADGKNGAVIGNWNYAIPKDISAARRKAALAFAKWFISYDAQIAYAKAGGIPNRSDVLASELARDPAYRWMPAYAETLKTARQELGYLEGPQVEQVLGLRLNQAMIGEMILRQGTEPRGAGDQGHLRQEQAPDWRRAAASRVTKPQDRNGASAHRGCRARHVRMARVAVRERRV